MSEGQFSIFLLLNCFWILDQVPPGNRWACTAPTDSILCRPSSHPRFTLVFDSKSPQRPHQTNSWFTYGSWAVDMSTPAWINLSSCGRYVVCPKTLLESSQKRECRFCCVSVALDISVTLAVLHMWPAVLCAIPIPVSAGNSDSSVSLWVRYASFSGMRGYRCRSLISFYWKIRISIGDLLGATRRWTN